MQGVEVMVLGILATVIFYIFRHPISDLLVDLFHRQSVVTAIEMGMASLLTGIFTALAKKLRAEPFNGVPDYVNKIQE